MRDLRKNAENGARKNAENGARRKTAQKTKKKKSETQKKKQTTKRVAPVDKRTSKKKLRTTCARHDGKFFQKKFWRDA